MSDGLFTVPIVTNDGQITGWTRGDYLVIDAPHHKTIGTDLRFLRYAAGAVYEISQEAKDAILAQDAAALLAARAAQEAAQEAATAASQADADAATSANAAYQAEVQGLRDAYAAATAQLCQLAGLPVVRCLTMGQAQQAILPLLSGEHADTVNGIINLLTNLEGKLCRLDQTDALDRV